MRTGRPKVALILTEDERRRLDSLAHRSRSAPHVARRARIILACADGAVTNSSPSISSRGKPREITSPDCLDSPPQTTVLPGFLHARRCFKLGGIESGLAPRRPRSPP